MSGCGSDLRMWVEGEVNVLIEKVALRISRPYFIVPGIVFVSCRTDVS